MSIALIVPGTLWNQPFVRIYSSFLEQCNIEYEIISWNRDGRDKPEGIQYDFIQSLKSNRFEKLLGYLKFARFVNKTVKKRKYQKLIVFGPQIGIFIAPLLKEYSGRYIFDYRDLSIEQNFLFSRGFQRVLDNSYVNVISSIGFKKALPSNYEYLVCHNFDIDLVKEAIKQPTEKQWHVSCPINILTIGGIRDFTSNSEVIRSVQNDPKYKLHFVGQGVAVEDLKEFCNVNTISNVDFKGFYPKEQEPIYIKSASFLNIYYPRKLSHDTALSNRFYNSLIFKRPMIVTKNTTQGDFVEQYRVGIAIENCENIKEVLMNFVSDDYVEYSNRCNQLLALFLEEQQIFHEKLLSFIRM